MEEKEFNLKILAQKDAMYRLARSLLSDDYDAQDAVQDTLMRLWNMRGDLGRCDNVNAFAFVVVRNNCLDRLRRKKVRQSTGVEHLDKVAGRENHQTETGDMMRLVKDAMKLLPEKQRTVMHLRDIEELEFDEISQIMDMNESTIRANLSRARKKIRDEMTKIMNYGL